MYAAVQSLGITALHGNLLQLGLLLQEGKRSLLEEARHLAVCCEQRVLQHGKDLRHRENALAPFLQ